MQVLRIDKILLFCDIFFLKFSLTVLRHLLLQEINRILPPNGAGSLNLPSDDYILPRFTPSLCKHTNVNGRWGEEAYYVCVVIGYWSSLWCECSLCHHNITITVTRCKMFYVIIFLQSIWCCYSLVIIIWYHFVHCMFTWFVEL